MEKYHLVLEALWGLGPSAQSKEHEFFASSGYHINQKLLAFYCE
jgi:hypothetical protein